MINKKQRFTRSTFKKLSTEKAVSRPVNLPQQAGAGVPVRSSHTPRVATSSHSQGSRLSRAVKPGSSTAKQPAILHKTTTKKTHFQNKLHAGIKKHKKSRPDNLSKKYPTIPPLKKGDIRIIPLGGVEEVGKNMTVIEYGNDIIVIDVGFQFEEETTPGIDYILPNTKYLEKHKEKIRGIIITHGHLDHIGGIPYILPRIGNPPIYTRNLTALMIKKRQEEFKHLPSLDIHVVTPGDKIIFGELSVKFFPVTHSIPDAMGISIETPHGNIVMTGDLKLDHENEEPTDAEKKNWSEVGKQNNLLFIADSTNVERPGFSITEREIQNNLEDIIKNIPGRIILGTFASQFERMIRLIQIAIKYNRKIVTEGRSIKTNIGIAKVAGLLNVHKDAIIPVEDINNYPPERLFILATGAQGEEFAALMRMANKKHKYIRLNESDTIVLSSSIIPGNEVSVQRLKDNLYRHNVKIIHYRVSDVHSTGHGNAGELIWINKQVGARYFMPAYGYHSMLRVHAQIAEEDADIPKKNIIVPDNGTIIELTNKGKTLVILKEKAPSNIMMVDGFSIGDIQNVVIRDRQMLAQDGIFVLIVVINLQTGKLKKSPDIIARGFVYVRESQELLQQARVIIKDTVEKTTSGMNPINFNYIKGLLTDNVSRFLFQKTAKRPLVIPVLISV